jgi:hypothetical protein
MIEVKVQGSRVIPVHVAEELESEFTTVNLRIAAIPPPPKAGLWTVELEYQVWNSSLNLEWKRLSRFGENSVVAGKTGTYTSIQIAIDSARPGGVVIVEPGHYFEDIHITKPLMLLAKGDSSRTLIFGQLIIESSNVTIDGFQFHALNSLKSSLTVKNTSSVSIQNCRFYGNKHFKFLSHSDHHRTSALHLQNSDNFYLINSFFRDCSVGLAMTNCTNCNIVGNNFSSCVAAVQTFSSDSIKIVRNYFVRNLVALEIDTLKLVDHILDNNAFEKNSAIIKKDKLLSRTDLEEIAGHSLAPRKQLSHFESEDLAVSPEVLVYGTCDSESEQAPHFQSPNPCIYITGEL